MLDRRLAVTLLALALAAPVLVRAGEPQLRPTADGDGKVHRHSLTDIPDMSKAVPASQIGKLPKTSDRYRALQTQAEKVQPKVEKAKSQSASLKSEADALRTRLVATAARVEGLEDEKTRLDGEIAALSARERELSASFAHNRVAVAHLLGILERTQHDMPPVLVLSAADALTAARRTMILGASLPRVYGAAADLARRLEALHQTRVELTARRNDSARNAANLTVARGQLDQLLAKKQAEADIAAEHYETLAAKFAVIAQQASDLGQLLAKVAAARADPAALSAESLALGPHLAFVPRADALQRPVAGHVTGGGASVAGGARAPGATFTAPSGGRVVAPAEAKVLFAGPYHRSGQVLILELGDGYDLVLAGLGAVNVRAGDGVLAGEPLGTMPAGSGSDPLYVELRHGEKAMSPLPWLETGLRKGG